MKLMNEVLDDVFAAIGPHVEKQVYRLVAWSVLQPVYRPVENQVCRQVFLQVQDFLE